MTSSSVSSLIFIDSSVDDYQSLIQGASQHAHIVILDPNQDGIEQISQALMGYRDLESIQIISHGQEGLLQLGATSLSAGNLSYYAAQLQSWSRSLADNADLLLYGCNVASGEMGQAFVQQLGQLTGADVAASNDLTGWGENWQLEYSTGTIAPPSALNSTALADYQGTLKNFNVSSFNDLRQAIETANTNGQDDVIYINGDIDLSAALPDITSNITFIGVGTTIDGKGEYRIFHVNGADARVRFTGLTLTNGRAKGSAGAIGSPGNGGAGGAGGAAYGGGLLISQGNVTLVNVAFRANKAIGGNGGRSSTATGGNGGDAQGGAIYLSGGSLRISKTSFLNNEALAGAGGAGGTGQLNGQAGQGKGGAISIANTAVVTAEGPPNYDGNKASTADNNASGTVTQVTPPQGLITCLDVADTAATTVRYEVTFDQDVTGVDKADFALSLSGIVDAEIGSVSGSGKSYIVEVNTGTGNGTLRLDLIDDDSIVNGDVPLGGTGAGDDEVGQTYTINKTPPIVESITRKTAVETAAPSVVFTVIFSEGIAAGVDLTDFAVASDTITDARVMSYQQIDSIGAVYEVTVSTGTGNGNLGLNLVDDNSIKNIRGVELAGQSGADGSFTGETYTIDKTPPFVTGITLVDATPTNKGSVIYEVKFSKDVTEVDLTDFVLVTSGVRGASLVSVEQPDLSDAKTYRVTVNTGSDDGYIQLNLKDNDSIKNALGVSLGDGNGGSIGDFSGPVYTLLKNTPLVAAINRINLDPIATSTVEYAITFTQDVNVATVDISDFTLTASGITGAQVVAVERDGSDRSYIVRVDTGTGDGSLRLNFVDDDSIKNALGVALGGAGIQNGDFLTGQIYTINKTPPRVTSINRLESDPNSAATVTFTVSFNENVNRVDAADFELVTNGITGASVSSVTRTNSSFYEVEVNTGTGNGTIGLNLNDNDSIINDRGVSLGGQGILNGNFTGQVYTIDKINPTADIVDVAPNPRRDKVNAITIDFSEAVRGFELSDLRLTRDGQVLDLSGASLTTDGGISWTLGNLKKVTNQKGDYVLSLAAGDSGITDVAKNPLTTNLIEQWTNLETVDACDPGIFRRGTNAVDALVGTADKDTLMGGDGNDDLLGMDCGDRLVGERGNDSINGGNGNDYLVGGGGNDVLIGGMGQDILKGGPGQDRFVFAGASQAEALATSQVDAPDRIQDFKFSKKDKFQLDFDNNLQTKNRPRGLFNAGKVGGKDLSAAVRSAYNDKNQKTAGKQGLKANEAVFFKWKNQTYLSVNDNSAGFAGNRDLVASVGITFKPGDVNAGVLSVDQYF